jgi:hypothetical protein
MLEQGHDSKNLRMLAGLDSDNTLEAQEHFQRAIRELGLSEPDSRTAMRAYACELAQQLATGTIDPPTGVRRLYDICVQSGYTHEFKIWFELDDALSSLDYGHYPWCYPTLTRDNQSEVIRQEAIKFRETFGCKGARQQFAAADREMGVERKRHCARTLRL